MRSSSSGPMAWMYFTAAHTPGRPARSVAAPAPESATQLSPSLEPYVRAWLSLHAHLMKGELACGASTGSLCRGTCWRHRQAVRVLRQRLDELQGRVVLAARPQQRHQFAVPPRRSERRPAGLQSGIMRCEAPASAGPLLGSGAQQAESHAVGC